jgi:hypothetical protein
VSRGHGHLGWAWHTGYQVVGLCPRSDLAMLPFCYLANLKMPMAPRAVVAVASAGLAAAPPSLEVSVPKLARGRKALQQAGHSTEGVRVLTPRQAASQHCFEMGFGMDKPLKVQNGYLLACLTFVIMQVRSCRGWCALTQHQKVTPGMLHLLGTAPVP